MTNNTNLFDTYKHKGLRKKLAQIVKEKGIADERIIAAITNVPRHFFLDSAFDDKAYQDQALQIGEGQTISQPYTVAYQTDLLDIKKGDKVLEIGLGSGYQACILLELGAQVYSIERIEKLFDRTKELLPKMGYKPNMILGDGTLGAPEHAPFDKILITAAAPDIPKSLINQLKIGGILVAPVGGKESQTMIKITKADENNLITEKRDLFRFVPLIGKEGWTG